MFLLPPHIYLPIALVLFVAVFMSVRRFIARPFRRSVALGFSFAVLFGGMIIPAGHAGFLVIPAWMGLAPVPGNSAFFFALFWILLQAAVVAVLIHGTRRLVARFATRRGHA